MAVNQDQDTTAEHHSELRELHKEFAEYKEEERVVHGKLDKTLGRVEQKTKDVGSLVTKYAFAAKVVWAGVAFVLGATLSFLGWAGLEISSLRAVQQSTLVRDAAIEREAAETRQELRNLRDLVQQHQINKREHSLRE